MSLPTTRPHDNVTALKAFVAREIAAIRPMSTTDALEHLEAIDLRLRAQCSKMTAPGATPSHLEGLGAWDFTLAHGEVQKARRSLEAAMFSTAVAA